MFTLTGSITRFVQDAGAVRRTLVLPLHVGGPICLPSHHDHARKGTGVHRAHVSDLRAQGTAVAPVTVCEWVTVSCLSLYRRTHRLVVNPWLLLLPARASMASVSQNIIVGLTELAAADANSEPMGAEFPVGMPSPPPRSSPSPARTLTLLATCPPRQGTGTISGSPSRLRTTAANGHGPSPSISPQIGPSIAADVFVSKSSLCCSTAAVRDVIQEFRRGLARWT